VTAQAGPAMDARPGSAYTPWPGLARHGPRKRRRDVTVTSRHVPLEPEEVARRWPGSDGPGRPRPDSQHGHPRIRAGLNRRRRFVPLSTATQMRDPWPYPAGSE
jgi:hypothetical protein